MPDHVTIADDRLTAVQVAQGQLVRLRDGFPERESLRAHDNGDVVARMHLDVLRLHATLLPPLG